MIRINFDINSALERSFDLTLEELQRERERAGDREKVLPRYPVCSCLIRRVFGFDVEFIGPVYNSYNSSQITI
jgi:hypothetical protein